MPNVVRCPSCDRKLRIPDEMLGKKVKCPSCRADFAPGEGPQGSPSPEEGVTESRPPAPRRPPDTGVREEPEEREGPRDEKEARPKKRRRFRGFKDHRGGLIMALGLSSLALGLAGDRKSVV